MAAPVDLKDYEIFKCTEKTDISLTISRLISPPLRNQLSEALRIPAAQRLLGRVAGASKSFDTKLAFSASH